MISICLIYSNERYPQAVKVTDYISNLPNVNSYDLIQVCDGMPYNNLPKFRQIVVERQNVNYFCRSDLWQSAVNEAKKEIVIILDCDRIVHPEFFNRATVLCESHILYCKRLYHLQRDEPLSTIVSYFNASIPFEFVKPDFRVEFDCGTIKAAKNPMSGCVAFLKSDYLKTRGMSKDFIGWGFNDTDFYAETYFNGFTFDRLDLPEFHIFHNYEISRRRLLAMNVWNGLRFYNKWNLLIPQDFLELLGHLNVTANFVRETTLDMFLEFTRGFE